METNYLQYQLNMGYLDNWLVAGPLPIDAATLYSPQTNQCLSWMALENQPRPEILSNPREWDPTVTFMKQALRWRYMTCTADHWLDLCSLTDTCQKTCAWAYTELVCPEQVEVELRLETFTPLRLWVSDKPVICVNKLGSSPHSELIKVTLLKGCNRLQLQMEQNSRGITSFMFSLSVGNKGPEQDEMRVQIPTVVKDIKRRQLLERVIQAAYIERDLYRNDDQVVVHWPSDLLETADVTLQLRDTEENIFCEGVLVAKEGNAFGLLQAMQNPSGHYRVVVLPDLKEYYEYHQRVNKRIDLNVLNEPYSPWMNNSLAERRIEALEHVFRRGNGPYVEMAKMELGRWEQVNVGVLRDTLAGISGNRIGSEIALISLLNMVKTFSEHPEFPHGWLDDLECCVANTLLPTSQNENPGKQSIQVLASCILAGQMFPNTHYSDSQTSGISLQKAAERDALAWMSQSARGGFSHWGSDSCLAAELVSLIPLAQWADNAAVRRLAEALANKLLFALAINSYLGILGSPQACADGSTIKHPLLGPSSGINRLLWGMGAYNSEFPSLIALATSRIYTPPTVIGQIARNMPQELWSHERHAAIQSLESDSNDPSWEVHKAIYRTPEYMLSSAQDWHPGERGAEEHIWQATLGPDAVVFTNHPGCLSENPGFRPNFWRGNASLPRVAQWKDVVIALYQLPADDPLGFTHAYFPIYAFDEYTIEGNWAFARKGDAYLALGSSQDLELVCRDLGAYRELRVHGCSAIWLCQMGSRELDGDFNEFCRRVRALPMLLAPLNLQYQTLRGDHLSFGWQGGFMVNGAAYTLHGSRHYDNRYCSVEWPAPRMPLSLGAETTELDLRAP